MADETPTIPENDKGTSLPPSDAGAAPTGEPAPGDDDFVPAGTHPA